MLDNLLRSQLHCLAASLFSFGLEFMPSFLVALDDMTKDRNPLIASGYLYFCAVLMYAGTDYVQLQT